MFALKAIYFLAILFSTAILSITKANEVPEQTIVAHTVYFSTNITARVGTIESKYKTDCFIFYSTKQELHDSYLIPKTGVIYYSFGQNKIETLKNRIKAIYSDYVKKVKLPSAPITKKEMEALQALNRHLDQLKQRAQYQDLAKTLLNQNLQELLFADDSGYTVQFEIIGNKILAKTSLVPPTLQLSCGRIHKPKAW